jgi:Domain of unknown function (DUF4259)
MGAWGAGVFENDTALDWLDALERTGAAAVNAALRSLPDAAAGYVDADQASDALAAAEIVAASRGHPAAELPGEAADWVQAHGPSVPYDLTEVAVDAVARIRTDSELRDLWEESGADEWYAALDDLLARLGAGS